MIIPETDLSLSSGSQVSARAFQSLYDMSSDHFVKGTIICGLHIFFNSGAMFKISFLSVDITPPDFGSSLEEMVPPVITIATFGNCWSRGEGREPRGDFVSLRLLAVALWGSMTLADRISDSLIPML